MALNAELAGKFLREQTVLSSGGEVQRTTVGEDGVMSVGGGMPGDDGGPAFASVTAEGLNGDDYWVKLSSGVVEGGAETVAATRKSAFIRSFARYAGAHAFDAAKFPVDLRLRWTGGSAQRHG